MMDQLDGRPVVADGGYQANPDVILPSSSVFLPRLTNGWCD
ncbi:hypothetical protein [Cryptosporangium minutisporangium]